MKKENNPYADIFYMVPPMKARGERMPLEKRAAQFAPFSALAGHEDALLETQRRTDAKMILAKDAKDALELKLNILEHYVGTSVLFTFDLFIPDDKKEGGSYQQFTGTVDKIDLIRREIFVNQKILYFEQVLDIHGELLETVENEIC